MIKRIKALIILRRNLKWAREFMKAAGMDVFTYEAQPDPDDDYKTLRKL